jgi:hypothetical protein
MTVAARLTFEETTMRPETVGMSSVRLARLDEVMEHRYVDGGYLPGMLTYVYRKGHLVHTGICGHWISNAASRCARTRFSASTR